MDEEQGIDDSGQAPPSGPRSKPFRLKSKAAVKSAKQASDTEVRLAPEVAKKTRARLQDHKKAGTERPKETEPEPLRRSSRWLEVMLAFAVVAFLAQTVWLPGPQTPETTTTPLIISKAPQPDTAAIYFLRALYAGRLQEAYGYLSSKKKQELSEEQFNSLTSEFLKTHRDSLTRFQVSGIETSTASAQLQVVPFESGPWNVTLKKEENSWYVDSMAGANVNFL